MNRIFTLLLFVMLAVAGCKSTPEKMSANLPPPPKAISDRRVVVEPAMRSWFRVLKVEGSAAGRYMHVEIDVQNGASTLKRFTYAIDWLDETGSVIPGVSSPGVPWTLRSGEASALIITAPTPLAKSFKARFMEVPIPGE